MIKGWGVKQRVLGPLLGLCDLLPAQPGSRDGHPGWYSKEPMDWGRSTGPMRRRPCEGHRLVCGGGGGGEGTAWRAPPPAPLLCTPAGPSVQEYTVDYLLEQG